MSTRSAITPRLALLLALLAGCPTTPTEPVETPTPSPPPILAVPESANYAVPALEAEAHVVWTDYGVPHIYAASTRDLAVATGFVVARDRYFVMEMGRRLALGRIAELIGEDGLDIDRESRGIGMTRVAQTLLENATLREQALLEGYADGVNAYLDGVAEGIFEAPSELPLLGTLLGADDPLSLLPPWTAEDMAGMMATLIYELGYETTDIRLTEARQALADGRFAELAFGAEREAGALTDIFGRIQPVWPLAAADGLESPGFARGGPLPSAPDWMEPRAVSRLSALSERLDERFGRDRKTAYGSNAWAIREELSVTGAPLLAGDGHLSLSAPTLFYRLHLNSTLLSDNVGIDVVGITPPGVPLVGMGHNGSVAWSATQLSGDINDYFAEQITLDAQGAPATRLHDGAEEPLVRIDESYQVAEIPALGSEGGERVQSRWETADGRLFMSFEGRDVGGPDEAGPGETAVALPSGWVVPADLDGDGVVSAISGDYTGFDGAPLLVALWDINSAGSVFDVQNAGLSLNAWSMTTTAADTMGNILFHGFQPTPCRDHLRDPATGAFYPDAHPQGLIDGTRYDSFELVFDDFGAVDGGVPGTGCIVPLEEHPRAVNPARGWVATANHDPTGYSLDGDLFNDPHYLGGPWADGWRAWRIAERLDVERITPEDMQDIQADHFSALGWRYTPLLLAALDQAEADAADGVVEGARGRAALLWSDHSERLGEARTRLAGWEALGWDAASGVATFYHQPDADDQAAAVATMIFNAWLGRFYQAAFGDEPLPGGIWRPTGSSGRNRALDLFMMNRGGTPEAQALASYNAVTGESVFFDRLGTEEVETSDELMVEALVSALEFLASPEIDDGVGGFGTEDMDQWLWGMRHLARMNSLLSDFVGSDGVFGAITGQFAISPDQLPPAPEAPGSDPRNQLPGFPRPGDNAGIDAANPGFALEEFQFGSGPVMRFVADMQPGAVQAWNVLPGGQSGLVDSPHHHDQTELWLANEASPVHFYVEDVVANATGRERLSP